MAIISQIPYHYLFNNNLLNVCFTLVFGLLIIALYKSNLNILYKSLSIIGLSLIADIFNFEYGLYGIISILIFYTFRNKPVITLAFQFLAVILATNVYYYHPLQFIAPVSVLIIFYLHKYDFKFNQILQYIFYPAHLFLILLLS